MEKVEAYGHTCNGSQVTYCTIISTSKFSHAQGEEVNVAKLDFLPRLGWVSSEAIISTRRVFVWICGDLARSAPDLCGIR